MQTWNKVIISMEAATEVVNFETAGARKSVLIRQDHIVHRRKMHYFLESPLLYSRQPYTDMIYPYLRFKAEFRCFYSSFPFVFPKICFYFKNPEILLLSVIVSGCSMYRHCQALLNLGEKNFIV